MNTTVKLDTTKLNQLIASVPQHADKITQDAAFLIEQKAKMNIQTWPLIDTGALLNSIGVEQVKRSVYQIGDSRGYKGSKSSRFGGKRIRSGMEYAVYWELGHHNLFTRHYMRMPFLGPAFVDVTNKFTKMLADGLFK
jgi:hypothetical protein